MKISIAVLGFSAVALLAVQAVPARADDYGYGSPVRYEYAKVMQVEPLVRRVDVSYPRRECWNEQVTRYEEPGPGSATPTLLGVIVGGGRGHRSGRGNGRTGGASAGRVLGAGRAEERRGGKEGRARWAPEQ